MATRLIVEDGKQVRVLTESILQGHTTISASTPEQAIAILDGEHKVDLLFTDLGLHEDLQAGPKSCQFVDLSRGAWSLVWSLACRTAATRTTHCLNIGCKRDVI